MAMQVKLKLVMLANPSMPLQMRRQTVAYYGMQKSSPNFIFTIFRIRNTKNYVKKYRRHDFIVLTPSKIKLDQW